jgi:hypothetical protein
MDYAVLILIYGFDFLLQVRWKSITALSSYVKKQEEGKKIHRPERYVGAKRANRNAAHCKPAGSLSFPE